MTSEEARQELARSCGWGDPFTLGWMVGLLEGEGCFTWSPLRDGKKTPLVQILMTDRDTIDRYSVLVGNGVGTKTREGKKDIYRVRTTGQPATQIMIVVQPHMSARRAGRIEEILSEYYGQAGIDAWQKETTK